jgi:chromosome transmission fidelity protein 18
MAPVRYAVRQVLDQQLRKEKLLQASAARHARSGASQLKNDTGLNDDKENTNAKLDKSRSKDLGAKRDFFGRIINESRPKSAGKGMASAKVETNTKGEGRIWVSFHEGFSNAVRKPITLKEFLEGF